MGSLQPLNWHTGQTENQKPRHGSHIHIRYYYLVCITVYRGPWGVRLQLHAAVAGDVQPEGTRIPARVASPMAL